MMPIMPRYNYYTELEIGSNVFDLIVKKYGEIIFNPFDGITNYNGFVYEYEENVILKTVSTTPNWFNRQDLFLKQVIWVRDLNNNNSNERYILAVKSEKKFNSWTRGRYFAEFLHNRLFLTKMLQNATVRASVNMEQYSSYEQKIALHLKLNNIKTISMIKKEEEEIKFKNFCKENNWTKQQIASYKKDLKDKAKKKQLEGKVVSYISKEMQVATELTAILARISSDCQDMQNYLSDPNNKLNIKFAESKLRKLKEASDKILELKTLTKSQEEILKLVE